MVIQLFNRKKNNLQMRYPSASFEKEIKRFIDSLIIIIIQYCNRYLHTYGVGYQDYYFVSLVVKQLGANSKYIL